MNRKGGEKTLLFVQVLPDDLRISFLWEKHGLLLGCGWLDKIRYFDGIDGGDAGRPDLALSCTGYELFQQIGDWLLCPSAGRLFQSLSTCAGLCSMVSPAGFQAGG